MVDFNHLAKDWWTERGWVKVVSPAGGCEICASHFGIAFDPDDETPTPLCEFHSKMSDTGVAELIFHRTTGRYIGRERWERLELNSYDRDTLIPLLSDGVLCDVVEHTLKNCRRISQPAATYDEALQLQATELARRLRVSGKRK